MRTPWSSIYNLLYYCTDRSYLFYFLSKYTGNKCDIISCSTKAITVPLSFCPTPSICTISPCPTNSSQSHHNRNFVNMRFSHEQWFTLLNWFTILFAFCRSQSAYPVNDTDQNGCKIGEELRNGSCALCRPGTYRFFPPKYVTTRHPLSCTGTYWTYSTVDSGTPVCVKCPRGTYNPFYGAQRIAVCRSCPAGSSSEMGATVCTKCPPGQYSRPGSPVCARCPPGFFLTRACKPGVIPKTTCTICEKGYYTAEYNSLRCTKCPPGHSTTGKGATSKQACKMCGSNGFTCSCAGDEPSSYSSYPFYRTVGAALCTRCPPGTRARTQYATRVDECIPCQNGTYLAMGYRCSKCRSGFHSFGTGASACRRTREAKCPRGSFKGKMGACIKCPPGYVRRESECKKCPPGTTHRKRFNGDCEKCIAPKIAPSTGIGPCLCPKNYFLDVYRTWDCLPCPYGTFMDEELHRNSECIKDCDNFPDAPACNPCQLDYEWSLKEGKCVKCEKGLRSLVGEKRCTNPRSGCKKGLVLMVTQERVYFNLVCGLRSCLDDD